MERDETWLTPTDIARRLGKPDSNVRYWQKALRDVLEERRDRAGHQTYRLSAFELVFRMREDQSGRAAIRRALAEQRAADAGASPPPTFQQVVIARLDRITLALERIADRLDPPPEDG